MTMFVAMMRESCTAVTVFDRGGREGGEGGCG